MTNVFTRYFLQFSFQAVVCAVGWFGSLDYVQASPISSSSIHRVYLDAQVTSNPADVYAWDQNQGQVARPLPNSKLVGGSVRGYFEYDSQVEGRLILGDVVREFEFSSIFLEVRGWDDSLIHSITTAPNGFRVIEGGLHLFLGPSAPSQAGYQLLRPTDIRITLLGDQFSYRNQSPPTTAELTSGSVDTLLGPDILIDRTNPPQLASGWTVPIESLRLYTIPEPRASLIIAVPLAVYFWSRRGVAKPS